MLLPIHHARLPFSPTTTPRSPLKPISCVNPIRHCTPQLLSKSAIQRITDKLQSLGYVSPDAHNPDPPVDNPADIFVSRPPPVGRVGYTIDASWSAPDHPLPIPGAGRAFLNFQNIEREMVDEARREKVAARRRPPAPSLAELTMPEAELRKLRAAGIRLERRLKVGRAGITEGVVNGIHERWRRSELVKIRCEEMCKMNMKRTHEILERKTGGLVIWRSGSTIILYRGASYKYPYFASPTEEEAASSQVEDAATSPLFLENNSIPTQGTGPSIVHGVGSPNRVRFQLPGEIMLEEEADRLLDGLGPRYTNWWGHNPLPVDADLLPAFIPGYRRPFRLLPYGVKQNLTDQEMTVLRRLGRPLPCHFALGRNKNLQGLAAAMIRLWEKCEIAKVAVKRGVQNMNSNWMAQELKRLTGGTLLSRDKEFIVFYRGKDFLPPEVSAAIEERRKTILHTAVECQVAYEKTLNGNFSVQKFHATVPDGEVYSNNREVQFAGDSKIMKAYASRVERMEAKICATVPDSEVYSNNREVQFAGDSKIMKAYASRVERMEAQICQVIENKKKVENHLEELERGAFFKAREVDKEGISEEERHMLRKVGLRMDAFLLLGRRGVFDGTVENMHLHWKYRELVKVICKDRTTEEVNKTALTLEAESGGILVAVERVSKGHAIIVYRGKNYQRPSNMRPKSLLNKREALKRSLELQRHQSLKLHVLKLSGDINNMKMKLEKRNSMVASNIVVGADRVWGMMETPECNNEDELVDFSPEDSAHSSKMGCLIPSGSDDVDCQFVGKRQDSAGQDENGIVKINDTIESSCHPREIRPNSSQENGMPNDNESDALDTFRPAPLSNKERLLLRRQALKMRKRPVLAIGRNNAISGVAKTIQTHFQKNPLAIVNIKGRAKGTSVQELIFRLEQATNSLLVSQEPHKIILYRGWTEGEKYNGGSNEAGENESETAQGISPQLMAAIRLECGW